MQRRHLPVRSRGRSGRQQRLRGRALEARSPGRSARAARGRVAERGLRDRVRPRQGARASAPLPGGGRRVSAVWRRPARCWATPPRNGSGSRSASRWPPRPPTSRSRAPPRSSSSSSPGSSSGVGLAGRLPGLAAGVARSRGSRGLGGHARRCSRALGSARRGDPRLQGDARGEPRVEALRQAPAAPGRPVRRLRPARAAPGAHEHRGASTRPSTMRCSTRPSPRTSSPVRCITPRCDARRARASTRCRAFTTR